MKKQAIGFGFGVVLTVMFFASAGAQNGLDAGFAKKWSLYIWAKDYLPAEIALYQCKDAQADAATQARRLERIKRLAKWLDGVDAKYLETIEASIK